jgi:hypothetical protein
MATKRPPTTKKVSKPKKTAGLKRAAKEYLNFSAFPPQAVVSREHSICLACVLDVFTRHLGLAPRTALAEINRYIPAIAELTQSAPTRPFFDGGANIACPYCGSVARWHARLPVHRIESGKATDQLRRALIKSLPSTGNPFAVLEEKATQQSAFFEWLEKAGSSTDFDDPHWLRDVAKRYLSRKEPKANWSEVFTAAPSIRRSRRLEQGWEVEGSRLFLAPMLFDELLAVHYLVSRSHRAGGQTFEGRYTLPELFSRLRNSGYLRAAGITAHSPSDVLEQLLEHLGGGDHPLKYYYIVDRRDLMAKAKGVKDVRPPRPKASALGKA